MVRVKYGTLVTQKAFIKRHDDDLASLRKKVNQFERKLSASPWHVERRCHPQDYTKAYTWDEFCQEAEKQLIEAQGKKKYKPSANDIVKKTKEMWDNSIPELYLSLIHI